MIDQRLTMAHLDMDGVAIAVGDHVELHPGCDLWMRGARYGTVTAIRPDYCRVRMEHRQVRRVQRVPSDRLKVRS